jgi:menaquinone-9 beta-reductase
VSGRVRDVVVVGGGPAGAAIGARLAAAGHDVLIVDRDRFPRPKPCGECLNPGAVRELEALGLGARARRLGAPITGWSVRAPGGGGFEARFPEHVRGIAVRRDLLDALLLEQAERAGAEVREGTVVTDVIRERDTVSGVRTRHGDIRARLVIGADGLRSVVVRRLGLLRRPPGLFKVALTAHVRGGEIDAGAGRMWVRADGCVGVADVGGGLLNVVVVAEGAAARAVAGRRDAHFDEAVASLAGLRSARRVDRVLATGPFDCPVRAVAADGAMLVGDAAGYFDPFTGQGVYRALHGAALAATVADRALRDGDVSARSLSPWSTAHRRAFAAGERVQRAVEHVVGRPRLFDLVAAALARRSALADTLVSVTGDFAPARALVSPRMRAA